MKNKLKTVMRDINGAWHLREMCKDIKDYLYNLSENPIIVEIGSYMGESTEIFAQEFPFATICAVDPWINGYDDNDETSDADMIDVENQFDMRIKYYKNIIKIKDFSLNVNTVDEIDMIYIDGSHRYEDVKADILYWKDKIKSGGIISGHDYYLTNTPKHVKGVEQAIIELLVTIDKSYKDGSWLKFI